MHKMIQKCFLFLESGLQRNGIYGKIHVNTMSQASAKQTLDEGAWDINRLGLVAKSKKWMDACRERIFQRMIKGTKREGGISMYTNAAYWNNSLLDVVDFSKPLLVTSCGNYRLYSRPVLTTHRPVGRKDYQLLYIASGKAHFEFNGVEQTVAAGNMVLYFPGEPQEYAYYAPDKTDVYWVHFTGSAVEEILREYEICSGEHVFYTGTSPDYQWLFRQMIQELQLCKPRYEELLSLLLRHVFLLINRNLHEAGSANSNIQREAERAIHHFREHYSEPISIQEYAQSRHISTCWFIRSFKQVVGMTPMQYILSVRMANAQSLLEFTEYNVNEIASIVGYDNPLYFSRLFKKQTGMSPMEYRKSRYSQNDGKGVPHETASNT